jgi:hypothetical protein
MRLKRPLVGFNNVGLIDVARAMLALPAPKPARRRRCPIPASRRRKAAFHQLPARIRAIHQAKTGSASDPAPQAEPEGRS